MRTLLKAALGAMALSFATIGCAAAGGAAILILDATAPMSAKLGQHRRIDAVKTAVRAAIRRMDPQAAVAIWAFGTNPSKKCEDKGELLHLQPAQTASGVLDRALSPLRPRAGRAPVFETLQAALEATGEAKDASVSAVIIASTGDDCTGDICKEANRLHSIYPNAKLTVLGAGMNEQSAANFTCAAKAMGGAFSAMKSASELDKVLRQTLDITNVKAVNPSIQAPPSPPTNPENNLAAAPETPLAAPSSPPPEPAVPQPPRPEPNTVLSAVLANGMAPLDSGVTWEIYKIKTTPTGQLRMAETPSWTGGGGKAQAKLGEGNYAVRVTYGYATAGDSLTVNGGKAEKTVTLNAGTIAAEGLQAPGGPAAEGVFFVLSRPRPGGAPEQLGRSSESPATFHVNAGQYLLQASAGLAKIDTAVRVEPGKVSLVRIALNVGTLEIRTVEAEGTAKAVPAWHRIYPAASAPGTKPAPLMIIEGGIQRVQLPAGNYRLETEYGNARVQNNVTVAAGQTVTKSVVLGAGEATLNLPSNKPAKVCEVFEAGAGRNAGPAGRAAGKSMSFVLKAGVYDLECRSQGAPVPVKPAQIRVVAGQVHEANIQE